MPMTCRLVWHTTSLGWVGQAAFLAMTVRYGAMRTVRVVVTYAELAQSYQYQAFWCGVSLVRLDPTEESMAVVMGEAFHTPRPSRPDIDPSQLANSQCQGSGRTPEGSAHAGWNHP